MNRGDIPLTDMSCSSRVNLLPDDLGDGGECGVRSNSLTSGWAGWIITHKKTALFLTGATALGLVGGTAALTWYFTSSSLLVGGAGMLCNRSVTPLPVKADPVMNPKTASAHPVSPEVAEFAEKAITEFPKLVESMKPATWPDYLQQSTTQKEDEPVSLTIGGKNIFDEHEVTTPSQPQESASSTTAPAGLHHPQESTELTTPMTSPTVKHPPVDERGEPLVKVNIKDGLNVLCPGHFSTVQYERGNGTVMGSHDKEAIQKGDLGSCRKFYFEKNQFSCVFEGIERVCQDFLKESHRHCSPHQSSVDPKSCSVPLDIKEFDTSKDKHESIFQRGSLGFQFAHNWLQEYVKTEIEYGRRNRQTLYTVLDVDKVKENIPELRKLGVDCSGVNSTDIRFEKNGDSFWVNLIMERYFKYKVHGLGDCRLAIDIVRPETSKLCDPFLPIYQDFKAAKAVEPQRMKGTAKKELDKRMSDAFYQEEWSQDQIEAIMLAKKTFQGFELPENLIAFLAGQCEREYDLEAKHRKPG